MIREAFIRRGMGLLAVLGCSPALLAAENSEKAESPAGDSGQKEAPPPKDGQTEAFSRDWVQGFLASADSTLQASDRVRLLEACGRACARRGIVDQIAEFKGRPEAFIQSLQAHLGPGMAGIEGDTARVVYSRCFCPLVTDIPGRLSDTWCNCSCGWIKEVFSVITGHEVEVSLLDSIKRGGKQCDFRIKI